MNLFRTKTFLAVLLLLVSSTAFSQKGESLLGRSNFDGDWKFSLGDLPSAASVGLDDKAWRSLDLPHDWSIEGATDKKNPTGGGGGYFPAGVAWYRKHFTLPKDWKDKKIEIYFEGVYMNAEVFLNEKSLGKHPYGFTSFVYDLTPYLQKDRENVLAVKVDNSQQMNCRWYSGSGIYRHVWLLSKNQVHIENWGVTTQVVSANDEKAVVMVKTMVKNETDKPQHCKVMTSIFDKKQLKKAEEANEIDLPANSVKEVIQTVIVKRPELWSVDSPFLYQAEVSIVKGQKKLDSNMQALGIRTIEFSAEKGFLLNGKSVKLSGGCVHHDNGCLGAAAFDRAEIRRVKLLKESGFNAVRTSHNPPSEAFLDACDSIGLLVIDEAFDGWREKKNNYDYSILFDQWWPVDLKAMIERDKNHPSIILWSIGNEIIERKKPEAVTIAQQMAKLIHQLDPTRPLTSAMTTWDNDWEIFDPLMAAHDVCGYNYQLHHADADHARVPSRIIVQTESYPVDAFKNWALVQKFPYIIGDFVWTAIDYLGESGIGRYVYPNDPKGEHWETDLYPWHGAYCGDIDLTGWRKPIAHYRNMLYNKNEKLYLAVKEPNPEDGEIKLTLWSVWPTWESWTWEGHEGKEIQVEVYSKYPKVKLYLNDKVIGEKATGLQEEYKAVFKLPYSAGVLKAVGMDGDKEMETKILRTAGKAQKIRLTADRKQLKADGQDLSFVKVEVTDNEGNVQPTAAYDLKLEVSGQGSIAGVDNANLRDESPYTSHQRKTWQGKALVVLKSNKNKGKIKLTVSALGLESSSLVINAR